MIVMNKVETWKRLIDLHVFPGETSKEKWNIYNHDVRRAFLEKAISTEPISAGPISAGPISTGPISAEPISAGHLCYDPI